jgi:TRAP-type C4-dicarboxylate transport system permease small subunit
MNRLLDRYCLVLDTVIAVFLAVMVVLVFGNVVLRYAFNSGITVSEEASRWLFVWITFLGSVVALHRRAHLGTDVLVGRLPPAGKKLCLVVGHLMMLWITWLLLKGSWQQAVINLGVTAPATGAPVAIVYAAGVVFAVSTAPMLLLDLVRVLRGQLSDDELVMVQESEDLAHLPPPGPASPRA